jgi:hypothetical protein
MSTESQIRANRENSQHSTGPNTEAGKAASSMNNFRHGLSGALALLEFGSPAEYDQLLVGLQSEHPPSTTTEAILVG